MSRLSGGYLLLEAIFLVALTALVAGGTLWIGFAMARGLSAEFEAEAVASVLNWSRLHAQSRLEPVPIVVGSGAISAQSGTGGMSVSLPGGNPAYSRPSLRFLESGSPSFAGQLSWKSAARKTASVSVGVGRSLIEASDD